MSDRTAPPKPPINPREAEKSSRLAAALRANLARRKTRLRGRAGQGDPAKQPNNEQG